MRDMRPSGEAEMIACFLAGELESPRFGAAIAAALVDAGATARLLTRPDLTSEIENAARRRMLAAKRGFGEGRDVFDPTFPLRVDWCRAVLDPGELAAVRYIDDDYWCELSGMSRRPADAVERIRRGVRAFDVPNTAFLTAAEALASGTAFPPLILVGPRLDALVCLEGNLRLTAHALAGFPVAADCVIGTTPAMADWAR